MKKIFWGQPNKTNIVRPGECIVPQKSAAPTPPPTTTPAPTPPPEFINGDVPTLNWFVGDSVSYDISFHFTGADSYSSTQLPAGVTLDSVTGVLAGVPTAVETLTVTATATNTGGSTDTNPFDTIVIEEPVSGPPEQLSDIPALNGQIGVPFSYDAGQHFKWAESYTMSNAPTWLTIDANGLMTGTPDIAQSSSMKVNATNTFGTTVSNTFTLATVAADEVNP